MNHPCLLIDEKSQQIALPEHVTERPCPGFKTLNELRVGTEQDKAFLNEHLARWGFGWCGKEIFLKHKHVIWRKQIFIQRFSPSNICACQRGVSREDDVETCNRLLLLLLFLDVWQWWIFEWIRNITSEKKLFVQHRLYLLRNRVTDDDYILLYLKYLCWITFTYIFICFQNQSENGFLFLCFHWKPNPSEGKQICLRWSQTGGNLKLVASATYDRPQGNRCLLSSWDDCFWSVLFSFLCW